MWLLDWLLGSYKSKFYRHFDPEGLHRKNQDNSYSKDYVRLKKTYYRFEVEKLGMKDRRGKRVKVWKLVKSAFDSMNDEFIPLHYRRKKK